MAALEEGAQVEHERARESDASSPSARARRASLVENESKNRLAHLFFSIDVFFFRARKQLLALLSRLSSLLSHARSLSLSFQVKTQRGIHTSRCPTEKRFEERQNTREPC